MTLRSQREPMNIGYARVSTQDQNLNLQKQAPKQAGCRKISGSRGDRGFARAGLGKSVRPNRPGAVYKPFISFGARSAGPG
jgi:DNA invertase Pin-like site-specific DNA recombinase